MCLDCLLHPPDENFYPSLNNNFNIFSIHCCYKLKQSSQFTDETLVWFLVIWTIQLASFWPEGDQGSRCAFLEKNYLPAAEGQISLSACWRKATVEYVLLELLGCTGAITLLSTFFAYFLSCSALQANQSKIFQMENGWIKYCRWAWLFFFFLFPPEEFFEMDS